MRLSPLSCRHPPVIGMSAIERWDRLVRGHDSGPKENQHLAEMNADGTYAQLTTDLVGFDPAPKDPIKTIK